MADSTDITAVPEDVGMQDCMLTTVDNPYDPFTQFREWFAWDATHGYHTPSLLAHLTYTSDELSELDQDRAITLAIDEVVRENISGMHRKVFRN